MAINYTLRQPIGVAACISPWNLPLYLLTWKVAPALAAGNTAVAKTSEVTPMTAFLFSKICGIEAGLPKGVLNIVHGLGSKVGDPLTTHLDTPIVSFTGGTVTGKHIASVTAPMFKKLSLELVEKILILFLMMLILRRLLVLLLAQLSQTKVKSVYADLVYLFKKVFMINLKKL